MWMALRPRQAALGLLFMAGMGAASCHPPKSAAERCRNENAWNEWRLGQGNRSQAAYEMARMRCDEVDRQERAEARADRREAQAAQAQQATMTKEEQEKAAAVRRAPQLPELGAGALEGKVMCTRQGGVYEERGGTGVCEVGGVRIFACVIGDGRAYSQCDHFIEDGDLGAARANLTRHLGEPSSESLSGGSRTYVWDTAASRVVLTMYERGVRVNASAKSRAAAGDWSFYDQVGRDAGAAAMRIR